MSLTQWVLAALLFMVPPQKAAKQYQAEETAEDREARYRIIAAQVAQVVEEEGPLPLGKVDQHKRSAALVLSIMLHESGLRKSVDLGKVRGDGGRSVCMMQLNVGKGTVPWGDETMRTWTAEDLVRDRTKCIRAGYVRLRNSLASCRDERDGDKLSGYTAGSCKKDHIKAWRRWNTMASLTVRVRGKVDLPVAK